ncbi:ADP-ribosyl-[dinitrogen reductase] glycohydrolase [Diplonema papillatum]|nr:ADP-ribosyl-[dinitrogen reductase] glycohydrolase [Diplonema papillatum]
MSIQEVDELPEGSRSASKVPAIYSSSNEDAGNGSIMRLAPVPIFYHDTEIDSKWAESVAVKQSRGTHPGPDAAACCRFMTFFIIRAIRSHKEGKDPGQAPQRFLDSTIDDYIKAHPIEQDTGEEKLQSLLSCTPPSLKEANWDWKQKVLLIVMAIRERRSSEDGRYNGYPVLPTYFGAYCMDGLAMALWSVWYSSCFKESVINVVNLLGDADTTGAIAAQMSGAMYGYKGIQASEMGSVFIRNLKLWDPYCEIGLRGAILYHHKPDHCFHPESKDFLPREDVAGLASALTEAPEAPADLAEPAEVARPLAAGSG